MTMRSVPADPAARARRKADLLAASSLLRWHAAGAVDELSDRADALARRVVQMRHLATSPTVRLVGVVLVAVWLARRWSRADRSPRSGASATPALAARLWPWIAMAWRLWRLAGSGRARWPATDRPLRR